MTTLALYLAFLIAEGRTWVELDEVLAEYARIEAFNAHAKNHTDIISADVIAEIKLGRKIHAIKIVRQTLIDRGLDHGLKIAKDLVDDYIAKNPGVYPNFTY